MSAVRRAAAGGADALMIGDGPEALQYRDAIVEAVRPYRDAGFTDIALIQIGGDT